MTRPATGYVFDSTSQSATNAVAESEELWQIPMQVRSLQDGEQNLHSYLFRDKNASLLEAVSAPIIVNAGGEGYYRVRYSTSDLRQIAKQIDKLTSLERGASLSDQFYLAISGEIPVKDYMDFTAAYKNEKDPTVISILCTQFNQMDLMTNEASHKIFAEFVRDRFSNIKKFMDSYNFGEESQLQKHERGEVLLMLGTLGQDKETINEARALAKQLFSDKGQTTIDSEFIEPVLKIVAYNGNATDYTNIEAFWQQAKTPEREQSAMMALALFQDPVLIQRTLKMALTDKVHRQDGPRLIATTMSTRAGRDVAWAFVRKHIVHIAWRFSGQRLFDIVMAMNSLGTDRQLAEVRSFFRKHPVPSQSRGIDKIIEAIEVRVAFRQAKGSELYSWLKANLVPGPTLASGLSNETNALWRN